MLKSLNPNPSEKSKVSRRHVLEKIKREEIATANYIDRVERLPLACDESENVQHQTLAPCYQSPQTLRNISHLAQHRK